MIGFCLDCSKKRELTRHGACLICGSDSIQIAGAVREIRAGVMRRTEGRLPSWLRDSVAGKLRLYLFEGKRREG